jgi:hypothetical protein
MDLGVAEHSLTYYPLPSEIICYHCQQSAEKFLKAVLVMQGIRPPKTYDLDTKKVFKSKLDFSPFLIRLIRLCGSNFFVFTTVAVSVILLRL